VRAHVRSYKVCVISGASRGFGQAIAVRFVEEGAKVLGINGRLMFETWYQCESFLLSGKIKLDQIVTHQIPLDDFERGFKLMQSGDAIKVVMQIPQS